MGHDASSAGSRDEHRFSWGSYGSQTFPKISSRLEGCHRVLGNLTSSSEPSCLAELVGHTDDAVFDPGSKRLCVAGLPSLNVFELRGPNRFRQIGQFPTSFHAITGILVPQLNRYYVAVNHHGDTPAQVQIYEVMPRTAARSKRSSSQRGQKTQSTDACASTIWHGHFAHSLLVRPVVT